MRTTSFLPILLVPIAALALASTAPAQAEPPIRIVIDLHMDPMFAYPARVRPSVYARWRDDTSSLLDVIAPKGAKLSFLSCGEFMEYVVDEGASGKGAAFLKRIYSLGGQIASHSHNEYRVGPHFWRTYPRNATLAQSDRVWRDNIDQVDRAIKLALGDPPPRPIRDINGVRGSHLPSNEPDYHTLMARHGFKVRQGGPEEDFYALFSHYIYHPYRPSAANVLTEDPKAGFVCVPQGAVIGKKAIHKGVPQDNTIEASKALFLQEYLNWRRAERTGAADKIWVFGHGSHGSDVPPSSPTRLAWIELVNWLSTRFVGKKTSRGSTVAVFDTQAGVATAFYAWEKANPGRSSHVYPSTTRNWALYPWLRPVAEELAGAHLKSEPSLGTGIAGFVFDQAGRRVAVVFSETRTGTVDLGGLFSGPVHVVNAETGKFLGRDPKKTPYGREAVIAGEGLPWVGVSGTPRIGRTLGFEVQGSPGESALFALGLRKASLALPPIGTLYVDPGSWVALVGPLALDARGAGGFAVHLPNDPRLSGLRLYTQAFTFGGTTGALSRNYAEVDVK